MGRGALDTLGQAWLRGEGPRARSSLGPWGWPPSSLSDQREGQQDTEGRRPRAGGNGTVGPRQVRSTGASPQGRQGDLGERRPSLGPAVCPGGRGGLP